MKLGSYERNKNLMKIGEAKKLFLSKCSKGGSVNMETKSRYEIISDLEEKKHRLMTELSELNVKESSIARDIEEMQKKLKEFKDIKKIRQDNLKDQIESIEKSLKRFDSQKK